MEKTISDSEWIILHILWEESPLTADEIIQRIPPDYSWKPNTVRTLINRLTNKKAVDYRTEGRHYLYHARIQEKDCLRVKNRSILNNLYQGTVNKMFAHFVDDCVISEEDIRAIRTLLDEKEREIHQEESPDGLL